MKRMEQLKNSATFKQMCDDFLSTTAIDPSLPGKFGVKRGLRNSDGSGVVAGITNVCCVHGYVISECDKQPIEGELIYRGYNIRDIVNDVLSSGRYGYEEVAYLLLFGMLPDERQLTTFSRLIAEYRDLPMYFSEDVIIRNPSPNIMNKMAQAVLALYSYDSDHLQTSCDHGNFLPGNASVLPQRFNGNAPDKQGREPCREHSFHPARRPFLHYRGSSPARPLPYAPC